MKLRIIPAVVVTAAAALIAVFFTTWVLFQPNDDRGISPQSTAVAPSNLQTETYKILGQGHIQQGEPVTYNSNPPTSGAHYATQRPWGVFGQKIIDQGAVHNLEHGGIWITYRPDLDLAQIKQLRQIAALYPNAVLMSPRAENDSPIAIVSWGRMMKLDTVDRDAVIRYIKTYVNNSPEKFASLTKPVEPDTVKLVDGKPFPKFSLSDVDGVGASVATLSGKPSLVWFTTSWCVPCQIGAKEVVKLDNELGGNAFKVLVIFVDPRENKNDLLGWKKKFANPDWQVAFDDQSNPLSTKIGLQYLDSKYLLDRNGVLLNQDFRMADDTYLALIRRFVKEN